MADNQSTSNAADAFSRALADARASNLFPHSLLVNTSTVAGGEKHAALCVIYADSPDALERLRSRLIRND